MKQEEALALLRACLTEKVDAHVHAVVLYGSLARGQATEASDIDLLVLGEEGAERSLREVTEAIDREAGTYTSIVSMTLEHAKDLLHLGSYFIGDILTQGVPLCDDGAFHALKALCPDGGMQPTRELIQRYIGRAQRALYQARLLLDSEQIEGAADRAYYAMHYAVQALLMHRGVRPPRTHHGLIDRFEQEIVAQGILSQEWKGQLGHAFELRQTATYEVGQDVARNAVEEALRRSEVFVGEAERVLEEANHA